MRNVKGMFLLVGLLALLVVPTLAQDTSPTPDQQAQPQRGNALFRAAHLIADAGVVDVYINGLLALEDVNPNGFSGWLELPAGRMSVVFVPADDPFENAILGPVDVTLPANSQITIAATGSVESGLFDWTMIRENLTGRGQTSPGGVDVQNNARITLLNSIQGAPPVNLELFLVDPVTDNVPGQSSLGRGSQFGAGSLFDFGAVGFAEEGETFTVPAGIYNVTVIPEDEPSAGIAPSRGTGQAARTQSNLLTNWPSFDNIALDPNTSYVFAVVGTPDDPFLVIHADNFDNTMMLDTQANTGTQSTTGAQSSTTGSQQSSQGQSYP